MSIEAIDRKPDTGLHEIRKLAEQHKARTEAEEAARRADVTPVPHAVAPGVALPVRPLRALPSWVLPAGAIGVLLLGAAGLVAVLALRARPPAAPVRPARIAELPVPGPTAPRVEPLSAPVTGLMPVTV